jgi:two-component system, NarL family, nitrate/nitrite response regulator NarL
MSAAMESGQLKVGILEAQKLARETLAEVLSARSFDVVVDSDPDSLLSAMGGQLLPLALVSARGDESGSEGALCFRALRLFREWHAETKVLVLSDGLHSEFAEQCYAEGAVLVLNKETLGIDELISAIHAVTQGERLAPLELGLKAAAGAPLPMRALALSALTPREEEILRYVAVGADNLKIAALLDITERTVRAHVSSLYRKLGSENRTQLALLARNMGVAPPLRA